MESKPYTVAKTCSNQSYLDLCEAVLAAEPAYPQQVRNENLSVREWAGAQAPQWRRLLLDETGRVVAHVGVRANRESPELQLCHLMVHPVLRRQDLASRMVDLTVAQFGTRLRALVTPHSPSHHLLLGLGWVEVGQSDEPGEPTSRIVLACVEPHRRITR